MGPKEPEEAVAGSGTIRGRGRRDHGHRCERAVATQTAMTTATMTAVMSGPNQMPIKLKEFSDARIAAAQTGSSAAATSSPHPPRPFAVAGLAAGASVCGAV